MATCFKLLPQYTLFLRDMLRAGAVLYAEKVKIHHSTCEEGRNECGDKGKKEHAFVSGNNQAHFKGVL